MVIEMSAGSAEADEKAETVSPCVRSPERTVTMVTPAGKWRSALRNSSDEITRVSSNIVTIAVSPHCKRPGGLPRTHSWHLTCTFIVHLGAPLGDSGFDSSVINRRP